MGKNSRNGTAVLVGVFLFAASLVYYSSQISPQVTHPDEVVRIRMSKYFKLFFMDHDFTSPRWQDWPILGAPPMNAYITGTALLLSGQGAKMGRWDLENWWNFKESFEWNLSHIALPSKEELIALKFTMALFVSLSCLMLFCICLKCFGITVAVIAALFFALHPLMLACATHATLDAPLVFFINTHILLMLFFYEKFLKKKYSLALCFSVLLGLNTGLATGTKIQGAITGVIFIFFCVWILLVRMIDRMVPDPNKPREPQSAIHASGTIFFSLLLFSVTALGSFILPNPSLYDDPVKGIRKMVGLRREQINNQKMEFSTKNYFHSEYATATIHSPSEKIHYMALRTFSRDGEGRARFLLKIVFFLLGFMMLLFEESRSVFKERRVTFYTIILSWLLIVCAGVGSILYVNFATHYFALVAPSVIPMAYCTDKIVREAWKFISKACSFFRKQ
jgi:hypothetical protein